MADPDRYMSTSPEPRTALAPELTRYLMYLLRRVFAHISSIEARSTQPRDLVVLASLAEQDVFSQQELAERLEINRTIMVKLIDRLEDAGYVTRTRNPDNRRSYILSLTDAGRASVDGMRTSVTERDERITAALAPAERDRLNDLLRMLLGEPAETPTTLSTEYLVTQVFYLVRRRGDQMTADIGIRGRSFGPLFAIGKFGPCAQQQLARYLAVTEPAAAQIVDELVQADMVERGQDPTDRRRYALELTAEGRRKLAELTEACDRLQVELVTMIGGPEPAEEMHSLLYKLLPADALLRS